MASSSKLGMYQGQDAYEEISGPKHELLGITPLTQISFWLEFLTDQSRSSVFCFSKWTNFN